MKKIYIFIVLIFIVGCSYNQINGYNLDIKDNIYKEYFVNESVTFLKLLYPPARHKIIFIGVDNNNFEALLINRLRNVGYAITELNNTEASEYKVSENEFKLSYSIDYLFKRDKKDIEQFYISLQLFSEDKVYSRVYTSKEITDIPIAIGNWSIKMGAKYE